ncbi:MAG: hypothetical protein IH631_06480, partial [Candidatus Thorarchaeota archaeon]|nr:hypothetical protein [Candidatus Thorarchaeota archaeon]
MIPKRVYRYGVASEKRLFDEVPGSADGFVLPAHLVVDQRNSLSPWLAGKDFCIDPMTHVWFSDQCDLSNSDGNEFKRSYGKIRDEYNHVFSKIVAPSQKLDAKKLLDAARLDGNEVDNMIKTVLDYQSNFVDKAYWDQEIEEYNIILKRAGLDAKGMQDSARSGGRILPVRLVLPYIYFTSMDTVEYELNQLIWDRSTELYDGEIPLYALIATDDPSLDWEKLKSDLGTGIHGTILWFSDIDEMTAQKDQLVDIRRGCKTLSESKIDVCLHSGGAYAMGLGFDGLTAVSAGITYGERRSASIVEGGPVPQRYFIPQLLKSYPLGETKYALQKLGIECKNPCCSGITDVD